MLSRPVALLACLASAIATPASAQRPPSPAAVADQLQAFGQWVQRVQDAMAPMNEAASRLGTTMSRLPLGRPGSPPSADEVAIVRAAVGEVRQAALRTDALLGEIPRFEHRLPGVAIDVNLILDQAREQPKRMLAYMNDTDALASAVERGDQQAIRAAAGKVMRGGFLILDSQVILYRGRQALLPPDRSAHQLAAIVIQLYRAMSVAADSWYQARLEGRAEESARAQAAKLNMLAAELEESLRRGRANLARESATFAADRPKAGNDPDLARIVASTATILAIAEENFAIGDEIVAWMRRHSATTGATLAGQTQPELILQLSAFEQRLIANMNRTAAALAEGRR